MKNTPQATPCEECEEREAVTTIDDINFCQSCADGYMDFVRKESRQVEKLYRDLRNN